MGSNGFQWVPMVPMVPMVSGRARTCQDVPGRARACQGVPGRARACQDVPGRARTCQGLNDGQENSGLKRLKNKYFFYGVYYLAYILI